MSDDQFSFPSDSGSLGSLSLTPVASSGVSENSGASGAGVSTVPVLKPASTKTQSTFNCKKCGKVYVRKFYYDKHVIAHDIADVNAPLPTPQEFNIVMDDLMKIVAKLLSEEPKLGPDDLIKEQFIICMQEDHEGDVTWKDFQLKLAEPLLKSLMEPSKLLPPNKYEEALRKLNFYLGDRDNMKILLEKLSDATNGMFFFCMDLARRLIFRMSLLLLDQIQVFIAKEMQSARAGVQLVN